LCPTDILIGNNFLKNAESLKDFCEFVEIEWAQILRHILTRWLSLYPAICRLTEKWPALKSYFHSQGEDNCDKLIWKFVTGDGESELSDENEVSISEILFIILVVYSTMQCWL
jgi:hypothetical protein